MKKFIYIIILSLIIQACDDYVDIQPRGYAIAKTLEDVDLLLNNGTQFSRFIGNRVPNFMNDNIKITDIELSTALLDPLTASIPNIYELKGEFYQENEIVSDWSNPYSIIANVNYILEVLSEIQEEDALKNQYTGEALVHRAMSYFRLVNTFGPHFGLPEASEAESGVPIITEFGDTTIPIPRQSVNDVYDFILEDLNQAINLLQPDTPTNARPSLASAYGLLAEAYLHMGEYEMALFNANEALSYNSILLDYNTELASLFGGFYTVIPPRVENPENILLREGFVETLFTNDFDEYVLSAYSDDLLSISDLQNDLRVTILTQPHYLTGELVYGGDVYFVSGYRIGVTVPELILIKAECLARAGSINEAMDSVNALRAKRFETSFVNNGNHILAANNIDEAVAHVLDEKRREFNVDGQRFFDIKRLNAIENAGISLVRGSETLLPNSPNWATQIPLNVIISSNGQITQNPIE